MTAYPKILLAVSEEDAETYRSHRSGDVQTARVVMVVDRRRLDGIRISGAYATPRARNHPDYREAYHKLKNAFILCNREAPRIV